MLRADIGISTAVFGRLADLYRRRWDIALMAADARGEVALPASSRQTQDRRAIRLAIEEALRWGEPTVQSGPGETLLWAVPLLHNARLLGGLVASVAESRVFPRGTAVVAMDIRGACADLRRLAEEHNLTNAALLEARRSQYARERERAEAIHVFKESAAYDLRSAYMLDEPMLIAAIRKGDRGEARAILNRLLVGMIHRADGRLDLVKSFFMELVVSTCRTAVEAGGAAEELLGANFANIAQLSRIESDEELATWLHDMLERIMESIHSHRAARHPAMLSAALRYMAEHCCEDISRDEAAKAACLSPSYFSRMFRKVLGRSFTAVLNQMRIDRAADLLARGEKDLKIIALETGFPDQSYFTKVFRRLRGMTPAEYRRVVGK